MNLTEEWESLIPGANIAWDDMCFQLVRDKITKLSIWPDNKNTPLWDNKIHQQKPSLFIFPLIKDDPNFILIIPGGAFLFKSVHEAYPVARAFRKKGFNVAILNYRCRPYDNDAIAADGMRGIQCLRHFARSGGIINPQIITVGFSAGGILTSLVNIQSSKGYLGIYDEISTESILPDAEIMVYGAFTDTGVTDHETGVYRRLCGFSREIPSKIASENILLKLPLKLPPLFMAQTDDDDPLFILEMGRAWQQRGIPFEMHLFHGGMHGGGLYDGKDGAEENIHAAHWFELCCEWIKELKQ